MRAQAKRSSGANRDGSALRGSVFGRRSAATRASSPSSGGSSAPSHRGRLALLALAIAAFALLAFAPLSAAKTVINGYGTSGAFGGQFGSPLGVAVNNSGVGATAGTSYVVDSQSRVQRFSPAGAWQRLWGQDVISTSVNEQQRIVLKTATAGTYTLSFNGFTTDPIAFNATSTVLDDALDALPSINGDANVAVAGAGTSASPFIVTFTGALAAADQPQLTADESQLTGSLAISTVADGSNATGGSSTGFEICTVATHCKAGSTTGTTANGGQLNSPQGIAVNQSNGHVYVTENGNRRVSEFDADGNFVRAWGWDVTVAGRPGDVSTNDFEICTAAADCKQASTTTTAPANGADGGRFGATIGYPVTDSSNNVWIPDATNRRIQEFDASGNFIAAYGYDVADGGATGTGTVTIGSRSVTSVVTTSKAFVVGQTITGTGIDPGTKITAVAAGSITLSIAANGSATGAGTALTVAADAGNVSGDEQQTVTLGANTTGGVFRLTYTTPNPSNTTATTADIAWNAPATGAGSVQEALENLANVGVGNVSVTGAGGAGGVYTITFQGARFADTNVTQMTSTATGLTVSSGSKTATVATTREGGALERCTSISAGACKAGTAGVPAGQFSGANPTRIAFDNLGNVYARDAGNSRVLRFDPTLASASVFGAATFAAYTTQVPENLISTQGGTRLVFSVNRNVGSPAERQILELDPTDASVRDTSLVGSALDNVSGLATDATSGNLYATTTTAASPRRVLVLGAALPDPALVMSAITVKGETTATFSGTIDPRGGLVGYCKFQYSTDPGFATSTDVAEPDCDTLAPAGGVQVVTEKVFGLKPNTHYYVRLSASRPLVTGSTRTSFTRFFDTDSVPPVVTNVGAVQVTDVSARMVGTINPKNSPTGYVFEYGTTAALGSSTAPVNIGAGNDEIIVSQVVGGLNPDVTYHFRLRATNEFGDTLSDQKTFHTRADPLPPLNPPGGCPNEEIRSQQSTTHLPDCLAYEMVTPPDKNQGSVNVKFGPRIAAGPSRDGNAAAFCTTALFGEPAGQQTGNNCAPYLSRRTPSGWQTANPFPPICVSDRDGQNKTPLTAFFLNVNLSPNFDAAAVRKPESAGCEIPPLDPAAPLPAPKNLYRQDLSTDPFQFNLLAPALSPPATSNHRAPYGGSDDYSHMLYISQENQTPDSPPPGTYPKIYEWVEQGSDCGLADPSFAPVLNACLRLVSVRPDGNPFTTSSKPPSLWQLGSYIELPDYVSADGSRIFFQNQVSSPTTSNPGHCTTPACDLYLREDGIETIHVSRSECTVNCGTDASPDQFLAANSAGDVAFFMSCAKLTDASSSPTTCPSNNQMNTSSGGKIYRWDRFGTPTRQLVDLTVNREPADGVQASALQIVGGTIADGGDTAFFVTGGQIVSGEPTGSFMKLYRWRYNGGSPLVNYLGPYRTNDGLTQVIGGADSTTDVFNDRNVGRQTVRVTPDGRYLLLRTRLAYDPAADTDADLDLYRWEESEGWQCISCQLPGAPSAGDVNSILTYLIDGATHIATVEPTHHAISDDGRRVFFSTPDALVPEDTNGEAGCPVVIENNGYAYSCQDIYLWEDGRLDLITSGTGTEPFVLMGATASGERVFFQTKQRLVGWDQDLGTDIYTARVNGGFPEPPPAPPACEGEACRGAASAPANVPGAGSAAFQGPENPRTQPERRCPRGKRKVTRNGRTRCVAKKHKRQNRAAKHNRRAAR